MRTCWGPWAAVVVIIAEVVNFFNRGMPWRGELVWAVDWSGTGLILVGPIVAGAAAVDAGRLARTESSFLVDPIRGELRPFLLPWLAAILPALSVHLLGVVAYILVGTQPNAEIPAGRIALALLVQFMGIIFYGSLGSAIGKRFGSVAGGAGAAIGSIVLFYVFLGTSSERLAVLQFGRATASLIGLQPDIFFSPRRKRWRLPS